MGENKSSGGIIERQKSIIGVKLISENRRSESEMRLNPIVH